MMVTASPKSSWFLSRNDSSDRFSCLLGSDNEDDNHLLLAYIMERYGNTVCEYARYQFCEASEGEQWRLAEKFGQLPRNKNKSCSLSCLENRSLLRIAHPIIVVHRRRVANAPSFAVKLSSLRPSPPRPAVLHH